MQSLAPRLRALASLQLRAPLAAGKKGGKDKGPKKVGELSQTHATGVAIFKGEEDPALKPDSEYPDWLWKLAEPAPTVAELQRQYEGEGLTLGEMQRLWRYKNKMRIKENNFMRQKE